MHVEAVNEEFKGKCKTFVLAAVDFLRTHLDVALGGPRTVSTSTGRTSPSNQVEAEMSFEPPNDPVFDYREEIRSLREYETCLEIMRRDGIISKHIDHRVGTLTYSVQRSAWEFLGFLLRRSLILDETKKLQVSLKEFDSAYDQLENFIYSDFIAYDVYSPVYGFESDLDVVELDGTHEIRKMTDSEMPAQLLAERLFLQGYLTKYVLKMEYRERKLFDHDLRGWPMVTEEDELGKLLVALRVFKEGSIRLGSMIMLPRNSISSAPSKSRIVLVREMPPGFPYELKGDETANFRRFWSMFGRMDMESDPSYGIVVQRFNYGSERQRYEDKLIDFFIAFEALLMKEKEGNIRKNLATRTGRLIGSKSNEQNAAIRKQMKELYGVRNRVVHGKSKDPVLKYACQLERLLQDSIKNFVIMLQTQTHYKIISGLGSS